jgi:hypothetical protein
MSSSATVVQLELKYCERCGGLWLRPRGDCAIYCARCAALLREFPVSRSGAPLKPAIPLSGEVEVRA